MHCAPSPYSPFFTSGLLSEGCGSASSSRSTSPQDLAPRRGSLPPLDTPASLYSGASHKIQSPNDESSAFYFTLQARRDSAALRSFLSLDLAESQSIRSASLRRKASNLTKSTKSSRKHVPAPLLPSTTLPRSAFQIQPPSPMRSPIRRASGDAQRPIPLAKPIPSTTPPPAPGRLLVDQPYVLPPITPSPRISLFSADSPILPPPTPVSKSTKASKSAASRVASTAECDRTISVCSSERRVSREDALASLEGRVDLAHNDFMDMSDDDDSTDQVTLALQEEEIVVISAAPPSRKRQSKSKTGRAHKRKSTVESWFPLASFIDLKEDDLPSWNWRNFIEVGGAN